MAVLVAINACHGTPLTVDQLREVVGRNYAEEDEQQAGRLKYVAVAVVVTPLQSGWRLPVGGWMGGGCGVKGALCRVGCGVWGAGDPPPLPGKDHVLRCVCLCPRLWPTCMELLPSPPSLQARLRDRHDRHRSSAGRLLHTVHGPGARLHSSALGHRLHRLHCLT